MSTLDWTTVDEPGQLRDERLQILFGHWSKAAAGGQPPSKDFVDPDRLGDLMGWLFLYKVERRPLRFLYLLSGPKIVRRVGLDLTGKYVDDHPDPTVRRAILANLTAVATTGKPHRRLSVRRLFDHDMTSEALVLPLAGPDGTIDHLLGLQVLEIPGGFAA